MVSCVSQRAWGVFNGVGHGSLVALDAAQRIFSKFDPSSDLLKLFLRTVEVADGAFGCNAVRMCYPFVRAARDITGFVAARNIIGKGWNIASGNAGWEHPMGAREGGKDTSRVNVFTLGKNIALAASDVGGSVKWLVTIGALSEIASSFKVTVQVFGKTLGFTVLGTVCAVGGVVGSLFAIAEDVRQIVWGGKLSKDGKTLSSGLTPSRSLDLAYRVALIAGIVFANLSGTLVVGLGFLGVSCILSLAKFLIDEKGLGEVAPRRRPLPDYPSGKTQDSGSSSGSEVETSESNGGEKPSLVAGLEGSAEGSSSTDGQEQLGLSREAVKTPLIEEAGEATTPPLTEEEGNVAPITKEDGSPLSPLVGEAVTGTTMSERDLNGRVVSFENPLLDASRGVNRKLF